jgi:hypothetical protein
MKYLYLLSMHWGSGVNPQGGASLHGKMNSPHSNKQKALDKGMGHLSNRCLRVFIEVLLGVFWEVHTCIGKCIMLTGVE